MRSKKLRWVLLAFVLIIFAPFVLLEGLSLYSYLQFVSKPSATEQLLLFAKLPPGTKLPTRDPKWPDAYNTDYQQVREVLVERFPPGTDRKEIEPGIANQTCTAGATGMICSFKGVWYGPDSSANLSPLGFIGACSDIVYVTFSFDTGNKLAGIEIVGATNCV